MEFRTGVIRPVQCFQEGWQLIKDQYWLYFAMVLVGMIIGGVVPFGIILGAMFCGLYYALLRKMNGERFEFGDLFKGFDVFLPSTVPTLIWILPMTILFALAYIPLIMLQLAVESRGKIVSNDEGTMWTLFSLFGIFAFVGALVGATIHAFVMFAYPLIMEKRTASGWAAFKLSARAGWANLNGVIGLIVGEFVLGIIGYLLCGIGVYFTLPLMFAGVLVAYRKVFPPLDASAADNLPPPPPKFVNDSQWQ